MSGWDDGAFARPRRVLELCLVEEEVGDEVEVGTGGSFFLQLQGNMRTGDLL
jgi:hypothetical protein